MHRAVRSLVFATAALGAVVLGLLNPAQTPGGAVHTHCEPATVATAGISETPVAKCRRQPADTTHEPPHAAARDDAARAVVHAHPHRPHDASDTHPHAHTYTKRRDARTSGSQVQATALVQADAHGDRSATDPLSARPRHAPASVVPALHRHGASADHAHDAAAGDVVLLADGDATDTASTPGGVDVPWPLLPDAFHIVARGGVVPRALYGACAVVPCPAGVPERPPRG